MSRLYSCGPNPFL